MTSMVSTRLTRVTTTIPRPSTRRLRCSATSQNKGSITVNGAGVTGLLIDPAIIHGNLVNEGTLQVAGGVLEGDGIRGLKLAGQSVLQGDLINAASGKILADGDEATGIQLKGGTIDG
ncbi:hypothetical protein ACPA9J_08830 [Pseudomonas aeruginosa]